MNTQTIEVGQLINIKADNMDLVIESINSDIEKYKRENKTGLIFYQYDCFMQGLFSYNKPYTDKWIQYLLPGCFRIPKNSEIMKYKEDIWIARVKLINPIFEELYKGKEIYTGKIFVEENKNPLYSKESSKKNKLNFRILSFANDKFSPHSVERLIDGTRYDETFTIGDHISNGTKMNGRIERFELSDDLKSLFVYTDWSGVGTSIDDIYKVTKLPSIDQIGDSVILNFPGSGIVENCKILNVHFSLNKIRYDISIFIKGINTRIYNIDECFVFSIDTILKQKISKMIDNDELVFGFNNNIKKYKFISFEYKKSLNAQEIYCCKCEYTGENGEKLHKFVEIYKNELFDKLNNVVHYSLEK